MAFDGITIYSIIDELKTNLIGGRVDKIYQPEKDEIILNIRSFGKAFKLLLTSNASNPRLHFTQTNKVNPIQPPLFCMVLRKHLTNGKILNITQPNFERIVNIHIESMNELGDYSEKILIIEVMGRHSNLILLNDKGIVLDCAKHVSFDTSSVREVLPGKTYLLPPNQNKLNPLKINKLEFMELLLQKNNTKIQEVIYKSYNGISPIVASEICHRAGINNSNFVNEITLLEKESIFNELDYYFKDIKNNNFSNKIFYDKNNKPIEFSPINLTLYSDYKSNEFNSISELLETYYKSRDCSYRINQKSQDLKRIITQNIERCCKKKDIQQKTLNDISNREKLKLFGELITSNIYTIKQGMTTVTLQNFYSENMEEIEIKLDPTLTPSENAQKYFKKYNKEKRTFFAIQEQILQNDIELKYLESIFNSLQNSEDEQDLKEIRLELETQGFAKKTYVKKGLKSQAKSKPLHYISCDGFDIFVGKNNHQNDELTLKMAKPQDIWLHTKEIPGSHVIIITNGKEVPNSTLNEAVMLSAYYSKGKNSSLVPVDYTQKKNVKKPSGAKPGMVIYETNKTAYITPLEDEIKKIKESP